MRASLPENYNLDPDIDLIEFYHEGDAQKVCHQGKTQGVVLSDDEDLVVQMYFRGPKVKDTKKTVVKRDGALVTKEELLQNGPDVEAATQK